MPIRHPFNPNLTLHYGNTWRGLPVVGKYSPFINEYLESILDTMNLAVNDYPRLFPLRFDLHFPEGWEDAELHQLDQPVAWSLHGHLHSTCPLRVI